MHCGCKRHNYQSLCTCSSRGQKAEYYEQADSFPSCTVAVEGAVQTFFLQSIADFNRRAEAAGRKTGPTASLTGH